MLNDNDIDHGDEYDGKRGAVCCYQLITHQLTGPLVVTWRQSSEASPASTS